MCVNIQSAGGEEEAGELKDVLKAQIVVGRAAECDLSLLILVFASLLFNHQEKPGEKKLGNSQ